MKEICVHLPALEPEQTVEVEVRVDGKRHIMHYRVEAFDCTTQSPEESRIERLRHQILSYDTGWELVQIGASHARVIPVMFRQRETPAA
ncbi:MAG: hypothetical protein R2834_05700 [Rhodothermales bacterium]